MSEEHTITIDELPSNEHRKMTPYEAAFMKALEKPKYTFGEIEEHCLNQGINPFSPWMTEDHARCEKLLKERNKK